MVLITLFSLFFFIGNNGDNDQVIILPPKELIEINMQNTDISIKANIANCRTVSDDTLLSIKCDAKVEDVYYAKPSIETIESSISYRIDGIESLNTSPSKFEGLYLLSANKNARGVFYDPDNGYRFKYHPTTEQFFLFAAQKL